MIKRVFSKYIYDSIFTNKKLKSILAKYLLCPLKMINLKLLSTLFCCESQKNVIHFLFTDFVELIYSF